MAIGKRFEDGEKLMKVSREMSGECGECRESEQKRIAMWSLVWLTR